MDSETEVVFAWVAASGVAASEVAVASSVGASGGKAAQAVAEVTQLGQGLASVLLKTACC